MKKVIANKGALKPSPRVLVSCRWNGEDNALAVGYCGNCSYAPPMVMIGIVPSRYSYNMIKNAKNFVVNLPSMENKEMFDYLGSVSKKTEDKLKNYKITEADMIDAPMLADCPVNIECEVVDSIMTGSHEMFIAKILKVHADDSVLTDDKIDMKKINLINE
ncbi:MAG: flavin reductase family protein [Bacilli bacterium]